MVVVVIGGGGHSRQIKPLKTDWGGSLSSKNKKEDGDEGGTRPEEEASL